MADPVYDGIDVITVTLALVLAAAIVFLLAQIVPQVVKLGALAALDGVKGRGPGAPTEVCSVFLGRRLPPT